ncbi:MAG: metallophosphoesterase [Thermovirgaceae bacterium]|nr:metallophosphoesterase [Thermovirgaceae bacterium]
MGSLKQLLSCFLPGMSIPDRLEEFRGRCLLHVSDTPATFYGDLKRLVNFLNPSCLVHTGDLVDDVKLAIRPGSALLFRKRLVSLFRAIETVPIEKVAIVCGNHDIPEAIRMAAPECMLFEGGGRVRMCGINLALGHSIDELPLPPADYNLYGHDVTPPPVCGGGIFLNGVLGINVIMLDRGTGIVETLPYPAYVDEARRCIRKMKL